MSDRLLGKYLTLSMSASGSPVPRRPPPMSLDPLLLTFLSGRKDFAAEIEKLHNVIQTAWRPPPMSMDPVLQTFLSERKDRVDREVTQRDQTVWRPPPLSTDPLLQTFPSERKDL